MFNWWEMLLYPALHAEFSYKMLHFSVSIHNGAKQVWISVLLHNEMKVC